MPLCETAGRIASHLQKDLCRYEGMGWYIDNRSVYYSFGKGWAGFFVPDRTSEPDASVTAFLMDPEGRIAAREDVGMSAMEICDADSPKAVANVIVGLSRNVRPADKPAAVSA